MKPYFKLLVLGVMLWAVYGCTVASDEGNVGSEEVVAEIEVNNLPDTVDVNTVASVKEMDEVLVLDVREQWEYDEGHIPGVTLIPMGEIGARLNEIPTDKEVIVTCRSGNRSGQVSDFLREQGYDNIHNMSGGILAWEAAGLPVEK